MAEFIFGGTVLMLIGVYKILNTKKCNCSFAHKESGLNYPWLWKEFGVPKNIEYEEPPNSGNWKSYTDEIWDIHCSKNVINHDPRVLVQEHVNAFINPETRFAKLRFTLEKNGNTWVQEPIVRFYELERDFFTKCQNQF